MAFFYHERYAHLVNRVFVDKFRARQPMTAICAHWQIENPHPPNKISDYAHWKRGSAIGVTKYTTPSHKVRWLVHATVTCEIAFDDKAAMFFSGAYVVAKGPLSLDQRRIVLDGGIPKV